MRLAPFALVGLLVSGPAFAQPLVSASWLAAHLHDPDVVVVDIRPGAGTGPHIPGAVPADYENAGWRVKTAEGAGGALPPVEEIAATIGKFGVGDRDRPVIISDDFGAAARVYWTFKVLGDREVSILDGGWKAWTEAGLPTDEQPAAPQPRPFTAHYNPSLRAELPEVAQAVGDGSETLVDARPPAQWLGTMKSPAVHAYGHLPHAVWIDQSSALDETGRLKPAAELKAIFAQVDQKPATTYCNTGHLAATDWFVLSEVLHHPGTKLYDGSLSEWTSDPSRPVVR